MVPDDKLVNEVFVAFAAKFASTAIGAGNDLSLDAGFFKGPTYTYDVALSCSYKALHVDYTWFNGTVRDIQTSPAPNGTISEIWHGRHTRNSVSGQSSTMQTILKQAAVQNSSTAFAQTWASLYSPVVMATVGGVTSERANSLEQFRTPILVVKVWIPALAFLAFLCVTYIVLGCVLAVLAVQTASRGDIRDARVRLTLWGLVAWAVAVVLSGGQEDHGEFLTKEQDVKEEPEVVGLSKGLLGNFYYNVLQRNHGTGERGNRQQD